MHKTPLELALCQGLVQLLRTNAISGRDRMENGGRLYWHDDRRLVAARCTSIWTSSTWDNSPLSSAVEAHNLPASEKEQFIP
jgi:hypothetical protein